MDVCVKSRYDHLGTRHIDNLELVNQDSAWIIGFDWMKKDVYCFPVKSIEEDIKLSNEEVTALQNENMIKYQNQINNVKEDSESQEYYLINNIKKSISSEVQECYRFSNYLVDPDIFYSCKNPWLRTQVYSKSEKSMF